MSACRYVHDDCIEEDLLSHLQQMKAAGQNATYHCPDCRAQFSGSLQVETQTVDTDGESHFNLLLVFELRPFLCILITKETIVSLRHVCK